MSLDHPGGYPLHTTWRRVTAFDTVTVFGSSSSLQTLGSTGQAPFQDAHPSLQDGCCLLVESCLTETPGGKAVLRWVCHHHPKTGEWAAQTREVPCPVFQGLQDVGAEEEPRYAYGTSKQHCERQKGFSLISTTCFPMFSNTLSYMDVHF